MFLRYVSSYANGSAPGPSAMTAREPRASGATTRTPVSAKLAFNPYAPQSGVLPGEPENELADRGIDRRPAGPAGPSVRPLPPYELAMPAEEGRRGCEKGDPAVPWDDPACGGEEDPVDGSEPSGPTSGGEPGADGLRRGSRDPWIRRLAQLFSVHESGFPSPTRYAGRTLPAGGSTCGRAPRSRAARRPSATRRSPAWARQGPCPLGGIRGWGCSGTRRSTRSRGGSRHCRPASPGGWTARPLGARRRSRVA